MVNVGIPADYVDTQSVVVTNQTDSLTYDQVTNVRFFVDTAYTYRQRTDIILELLTDLRHQFIEFDAMLTQPEVVALYNLTTPTNNTVPEKSWKIDMTDEGGSTATVTVTGMLAKLEFIDEGIGAMKYRLRIVVVTQAGAAT